MVRKKQGNFYNVYVIPADQVQSTIAMDDEESTEASVSQTVESNFSFWFRSKCGGCGGTFCNFSYMCIPYPPC